MSSEPKAVAWQYRFNTQEGWGSWYDCQEHQLYLFEGATDSEVRPLYDEQALSALRAEVDALRAVLAHVRQDINWMTNEGKLLNRHVFRYLDAAMEQSA